MNMADPLLLAVSTIGIFLGAFTATMAPYWKKLKEAMINKTAFAFDPLFLQTAIFSAIVAFIATMAIIVNWTPPDAPLLIIFATSFTNGFTADSIINLIVA